ncbi:MAG: trypsin-like serine protease, partial [Thermoguttaceae bacterium]|nr:trypsin-like serine protease [Thermoguttaceae bacterium]
MSLSRKNKVWSVAELLTGRFAKKRLEKARGQKPTKLLVDQLEERQLLSLTVGTTDNILVNDGWQDVRGEVAVDSNNSGDMIVAWTGADRLANPDYDATNPDSSPYLLDENGKYVEDLNVYARYLTNEVQIITIPQELVPGTSVPVLDENDEVVRKENGDPETTTVQSGSFELVYNAYETQRFSIYKSIFAQGDEEDAYPTTNSLTCFNLGFYAEGELTWILFKYDSALLPSDNAANLESAIRAIPGGEYANATVTAVSETDFDITFYGGNGVDFAGKNLSDIKVRNDYYNDLSGILEKVKATDFDPYNLRSCTSFQKMILKDLFGDNYQRTVEQTIATQGKKTVVKILETELDAQADVISSGVVTTVDQVQNITTYSSKTGAALGINVSADPWQTAKNIQNAFNAVNVATLYAPVTRGYVYDEATHTYTYTETPARAYSSDQAYGEMQGKIPAIEVSVVPVPGTTNQFQITFVGADGLQDQDALIVSAGTYVTKTKTANAVTGKPETAYKYRSVINRDSQTGQYGYSSIVADGVVAPTASYSPYAQTIKENSAVFRVNAPEVAEFVLDEDGDVMRDFEGSLMTTGTGRTNQMKPDVAMSADGTFVVVWESENDDATQPYNQSDIMARRFVVQGCVDETDPKYENLFFDNGAEGGFVGYVSPETDFGKEFVADPYALTSQGEKVQCVAPVANEFVVNASLNGRQTDPTIGADKDGAFIVAWTSEAQKSSYFGGIYARQFDSLAQPLTGDITLASSQIGTNYYGPADAAMSADGFAVVAWNYNTSRDGATTLYHSVLEPQSAKFVVDHEVVAQGGYGASVSFTYGLLDNETGDYTARYGIAWTQQEGAAEEDDDEAAANAVLDVTLSTLPATNVASAVYELTGNMLENEIIVNAGDDDDDATGDDEDDEVVSGDVIHVGTRETSSFVATAVQEFAYDSAGNQGNPSIALDADGDVFLAYQGFNSLLDIQSTNSVNEVESLLDYDILEDKYITYPADSEELAIRLAWSDFEANLVYKNKRIDYGDGKFAYEDKNEDLVDFVKLALGWGYDEDRDLVEFGGDALYGVAKADCIDVDTYERRFLAVAQKEGATVEQLTRLHAVLEALLSPLRNNGNDVTLRTWNQEYYGSGETVTAGENMGLVSNLRDGSNACFYLAFPNNYVASATTTLWLGRQDAADNTLPLNYEEVAIDLSGQYNADYGGIILNPFAAAQAVADALNASALANGDANAFVARYVPLSEVEFYKGTLGEIDVNIEAFEYSATVDDVLVDRLVEDYFVVQIVAQNSLHDTPLHIYQAATGTSVKLLNQTSEDFDYGYSSSLFVERNGSLGAAQTNPALVSTSNGDLTVAWGARASSDPRVAYNTYPNVGNPIDAAFTHIYVRPFVESTDNAGPTVVNVSLPNGDKVQKGEMVTSALRDVVVSFSEEMMTMGDGSNYYNKLHAVDNIANWTLLRDGVEVTGAIESVTFGMNASQQLAKNTVDENNKAVEEINDGVLAYGTNRWEAVITFAEGFELNDGDYTLVCSSMVQDIARNAIYSQGYAVDGSGAGFDGRDWKLDFSVVRLNEALGFEYGDGFQRDNYIPEDYIEYDPTAPSHQDGVYGPVVYTDYSSLKQVTRSSILNETSDYGPNTAQSVASNANGDFVTTWVETLEEIDEETGIKTVTQTVWAKAYRALYVMNAEGVREQIIDHSEEGNYVVVKVTEATAEFEATTNKKGETVFKLVEGSATLNGEATKEFADPRQASVAIADRGEFVVVWDMITDGDEEDGSRDVYMAKYAFNGGQMKINGKTEAERVNIETEKDQQYASVAMDADGDVVVVWESYEQDGSGWGVYGRRFMTDGSSLGCSNTIQQLTFVSPIKSNGDVLTLSGTIDKDRLDHGNILGKDVEFDAKIELKLEMKLNAETIKTALLEAINKAITDAYEAKREVFEKENISVPETPFFTEDDLEVAVTGAQEISFEFKGDFSATFVNLMEAERERALRCEVASQGAAATQITLVDEPAASGDVLTLNGSVNGNKFKDVVVRLTSDMPENARRIQQALEKALEKYDVKKEDIIVVGKNFGSNGAKGEIAIEFKNCSSVEPMSVEYARRPACNLTMQQIGKRGAEFAVNETTENNQRFASIAMERDGGFVVSWTSWGQDGDSAVESNIYARKFASNHLVSRTVGTVEDMTPVADNRSPQIITNGEIDNYEAIGDMYSSVAYIQVGGLDAGAGDDEEGGTGEGEETAWTGSGSLLTTGMHVLTAAHVVCNEDGTVVDLEETPMYVTFHTSYGAVNIEVADIFVHETYTGDPINDAGVDLAVITLKNAAPTELKGYELYDDSDEIGQRMTMVGYGLYGEADETPEEAEARESGVKHFGDNVFELTGDEFLEASHPNLLVYDLDDGTVLNDYFGNYYGVVNRGLGEDEAGAAQGDSGGPALINNKIAGVCSWGESPSLAGGFGVYVRVSAYVDWINEAI